MNRGFLLTNTAGKAPATVEPGSPADLLTKLLAAQSARYVQHQPSTTVPLPLAITLDDGTARDVVLVDVQFPIGLGFSPQGNAGISVLVQYAPGGAWHPGTDQAITASTPAADRQTQIQRCHAIRFQRTAGGNATSTVELS